LTGIFTPVSHSRSGLVRVWFAKGVLFAKKGRRKVEGCGWRVAGFELRVAGWELHRDTLRRKRFTEGCGCGLWVVCYGLWVMG